MSHTSDELKQKLEKAKKKVEIGGIYYHYKNPDKYYVVESIGFIESTEEICVIYRALYDKGLVRVRTIENFLGRVDSKPRFSKKLPAKAGPYLGKNKKLEI